MMPTEHDEALVERVALYACNSYRAAAGYEPVEILDNDKRHWITAVRPVIYPPAPPKTRLQVARELLATARFNVGCNPNLILEGRADESSDMQAILAALALPAMED